MPYPSTFVCHAVWPFITLSLTLHPSTLNPHPLQPFIPQPSFPILLPSPLSSSSQFALYAMNFNIQNFEGVALVSIPVFNVFINIDLTFSCCMKYLSRWEPTYCASTATLVLVCLVPLHIEIKSLDEWINLMALLVNVLEGGVLFN